MFRIIQYFKRRKPDYIVSPKEGFGFVDKAPKPEDFILGSSNQALKIILSEERDYTKYLPDQEKQSRGFDSYSCVVYSGLNAVETVFKKQYNLDINLSDRFLAGMIPVNPMYGTNYLAFWDTFRTNGDCLEEEYPWGGKNGVEYVKRPPNNIIQKAKLFLNQYEIQHEWVDWAGCDPNKLYDALKYSPLQASVDASATYTGKYSRATNHSIMIYKAVKGISFSIFDHYSRETYELPWNFYFGSAKQCSIIAKKKIQLVQMPFHKLLEERAKIYAIFGSTACHIVNEYSWNYGSKLGIWDNITLLTQNTFNNKFTIGKQLTFK